MKSITLFNQNLAEIKVSYSHKVKFSEMEKIGSSSDAYNILRRMWGENMDYVEEFYVVLMNRANKVLGYSKVSQGGMTGTIADPKVIFQIALKSAATSILLAHNHPSGNNRPSDADIQLTKRIKEAGQFLELPVLDHLIITSETYFSFADEGLL